MKPIQHPSSAELIAYLDGECDRAVQVVMQRHLQQCWKCRSRAAEMERTISGIVAEIQKPTWPADEHETLARERLAARLRKQGSEHREAPGAWALSRWLPRVPKIHSVRYAAMVGFAAILMYWTVGAPLETLWTAAEIVEVPHAARTAMNLRFAGWENAEWLRRAETGAWRGSHRIRTSASTSAAADRVTVLESMNNGGAGDYHLRLVSERGAVQLAAWQPGPDPRFAYVYSQRKWGRLAQFSRGSGGAAFGSIPALGDGFPEEMQDDAVFPWVQALVFHGHMPTRRLAELAQLPGSRVENRLLEGRSWACVHYQQDGRQITDCLEGDAQTGDILRERLRIQTKEAGGSERFLDVEISWAPARAIPASALYEEDFLPSGLRTLDLARAQRRRPIEPLQGASEDARRHVLAAALDAEEALLVLAAVSGPELDLDLRIVEDAVVVEGRVATAEQYQSLRETVLPLASNSAYLRFNLQVAETAPLPPPGGSAQTDVSGPANPPATAALALVRPSMSKEEVRDFCNRAVRLSGEVVRSARHMASAAMRYSPMDEAILLRHDRQRLAEIRLRYDRQFRLALGDFHQFLVQAGLDEQSSGSIGTPAPQGSASSAEAPALYEAARALHANVLREFAVGHPPNDNPPHEVSAIATQVRSLLRANLPMSTKRDDHVSSGR
ncbi:MAG: hypothetical protein KIT83_05770 [Bryobacterales bacterium]|nr:hypothetical protein [Bryobacterales bacterium]